MVSNNKGFFNIADYLMPAGKTKASHLRGFTFPIEFCIIQNTKHWSNEEETLKLIDTIINPYFFSIKKRKHIHISYTYLY